MSPTDTSHEKADGGESGAAVSLRDVSKAFGGKTVLASVSLDIAPGSVVALLGANGAGKSTLIKILSGVHADHGGEVLVDGSPAALRSPLAARQLGIQTVHQRISEGVVPGLTVAENLGFEELAQRRGNPFLNGRRQLARAREIQANLGLDWTDAVLKQDVTELGISDRQLLILARALATRPRLLILDEPTSALSAAEAERLFALVEGMRNDGIAVLYVSHRLGEIDALADRLVVLRDGRLTEDQTRPFDWDAALRAMLAQAHETTTARPVREGDQGDVVLSLKGVPLFEGRPRSISTSAAAKSPASSACWAPARPSWPAASSAPSPSPPARSSWTAGRTRPAAPPTPSATASTSSPRTGTPTPSSPAGRWPRTSPCRSSGPSRGWA